MRECRHNLYPLCRKSLGLHRVNRVVSGGDMETTNAIKTNGKTVSKEDGLVLYCDTHVAIWNAASQEWGVQNENGYFYTMDKLACPWNYYSAEEWRVKNLRQKWLGFDADDVNEYVSAAYKVGVNPLPALRDKFPQHKWEFSGSVHRPDGSDIVVHKLYYKSYVSWNSGSYMFKQRLDAATAASVVIP